MLWRKLFYLVYFDVSKLVFKLFKVEVWFCDVNRVLVMFVFGENNLVI